MHALGIDDVARAEAVARGARAVRAVEREHARLDRRQRDAAVDARESLAQPEGLVVAFDLHEQAPLAELERELDAVGEAPLDAVLQDDAVDDDVEVVRLGAVELDLVAEVDHRPVDARADEALAPQPLELELQLPLAGAGDRREHATGARRRAAPRTRSTICWTVCASMRLPQFGQWGTPTRAKSRRR